MYIKDLIAKLEEIYNHDVEHLDMMGEPEVHIDMFEEIPEEPGKFRYCGVSADVVVDITSDYVYRVLTAFAPEE